MKQTLLVIAGAALGGTLGYFVFFWIALGGIVGFWIPFRGKESRQNAEA
ncbi:MAG TPA: hypothetical protein VGM05_25685 [Planctomycetaceae bacterium]|jgi:hypothetical protein